MPADGPPRDTTGGGGPSEALSRDPHRRHDPLLDEWVLVSSGRTRRPWLGAEEADASGERAPYEPACYLCPGNARANGVINPRYESTFVFVNDFSALRADTSVETFADGLLRAEGEQGECRVVCFSPRHDLTLAAMSTVAVREVIDLWIAQTEELGRRFRWVQVFENRGVAMGASNPHPHGQIWAGTALPVKAQRELATQTAYIRAHGRPMLLDYVGQETGGPRVIHETAAWLVVVPFWASWPFETMLIPKRPAARLSDLAVDARDGLAAALQRLLRGYDALFRRPFPYSMGWHQAPFGMTPDATDGWQLHAHLFPPLLQANVRKFMVGYELLAETQRDVAPEDAADRLRTTAATLDRLPLPEPPIEAPR